MYTASTFQCFGNYVYSTFQYLCGLTLIKQPSTFQYLCGLTLIKQLSTFQYLCGLTLQTTQYVPIFMWLNFNQTVRSNIYVA